MDALHTGLRRREGWQKCAQLIALLPALRALLYVHSACTLHLSVRRGVTPARKIVERSGQFMAREWRECFLLTVERGGQWWPVNDWEGYDFVTSDLVFAFQCVYFSP